MDLLPPRRKRLSSATIDVLPASVARPGYRRTALQPGILHLGVGAFHRCHQAEWTDDALAAEFGAWGIVGVNLRAPDVESMLRDQDGYFCRIVRENGTESRRLVGAIVQSISVLGEDYDPKRLTLRRALEAAADPQIRVFMMTVTEKGYCHVPATGELDMSHPDIAHDLAYPLVPVSVPGFIVHALALRLARGIPMPTLVSCDNVANNGSTLRRCVVTLAAINDKALAATIGREARFPNTMVDRIVPATLEADVEGFATDTGIEDFGLVVGEPFRMWVIESTPGAELPSWDKAGALIVEDVMPYELLKMRVLNGIQSNVCQLGVLSDLEFMADVMAIDEFDAFARRVIIEEVVPHLLPVPGIDLAAYIAESIRRLKNPDLKHRTLQISTDGSQKIKQRLLQPIRDALEAGTNCDGLLLGVAGWIQYAAGHNWRGQTLDVRDPISATTREIGRVAAGNAAVLVDGMLGIESVFGTDLRRQAAAVSKLTDFVSQLSQTPTLDVVRTYLARRA